ncbi:hypothetical protein mRhiFer1_003420 [Rhinolophus ferrumequinum]|uniref:Alpha-S2-casein n=1 Tax=Rhinolophus ferrumequinum TaxID=59479 RepID=A0A7J7ZBY1_RHIFE|nr:hypothetical protein mRhiFer1_003420 [Rhinolophus ferrumequinum]
MKFFVFTCLLAVALAKHKMEDSSSSEESANISQEKFKQETKVVIRPSKESAEVPTKESASFSQEENPKTADMNKISQYYQKFPVPQYLKTVHQHQTTVKPWNHIKTNAYQIIPTLV